MITKDQHVNEMRRTTVGDVLRRTALRAPDRVAVIAAAGDGEISMTWREFDEAINRAANGLAAAGVTPGAKVGVFSRNSLQFVILIYATMRLGATIAPVGGELRGRDLRFVVEHSLAEFLFVEERLIEAIKDAEVNRGKLTFGWLDAERGRQVEPGWLNFAEIMATEDASEPVVCIETDDLASLTYTSGTEAAPKGAMMSHGNLCNIATTQFYWGLSDDDVTLHVLPLFYTGGLGVLTAALLKGQTVVLLDLPEIDRMVSAIRRHQVTYIVLPPTLWIRLARAEGIAEAASSLRTGVTFGATISETMLREWHELLPQFQWISYYGQSETSCSGAVGLFKDVTEIPEEDLGWVGRPAADLDVRIIDLDGRDVTPGEVGEIVFRGPAVFQGYFRDEERTAEVFRDGWLHSGDLGRLNEDGQLFYVDRMKDMVKSGGENISSASVEYAISGLDKVAEVAAFGVPHPEWMEALAVAVTVQPGELLTEEELLAYCREHLPRFKQPKHILILSDFPRGPSGKILKRVLRESYADLG